MDLLGMLKDQVAGTLGTQASKFLGESESGVTKALDGIFPSLLGSTIESAKNEAGASKLLDMLKGMDTNGLDDIAGIFGGGASSVSKLMNQGSGIMNMLMGNKSGGMIDAIAKFAGLRGSSSSSLIKMAAPFLMKMIAGHVMKNKLNPAGLMDFLKGQKSHVKSALPAGLASSLGLSMFGDATDAGKKVVSGATNVAGDAARGTVGAGKKVVSGAANVAGDVGNAAVKTGGGIMKWLLPVLLGLLVLGFLGFRTGCGAIDNVASKTASVTENVVGGAADAAKGAAGAVGDAAKGAVDVAGDAAGAVGDAVGDAAGAVGNVIGGAFSNVNEAAKKTLDGIKFTSGSAGSQMMDYVKGGFKGDGNFRFKGLTFDTGSAKISGATASEVDNVASILAAYPDVKVTVNGYTDNTGDPAKNVQLSQARADSVKARLTAKGIAPNRISTKGHGSANPVGDNSTPDGRRENRRIEMSIMK